MSTVIRNELSKKNKWFISKHRYLELKHFCLQYPEMKEEYNRLYVRPISRPVERRLENDPFSDPVGDAATRRAKLFNQMRIIEQAAIKSDAEIADYILLAVTNGVSWEFLKTKQDIPCCRETYYDRYRKFFWCLDKER